MISQGKIQSTYLINYFLNAVETKAKQGDVLFCLFVLLSAYSLMQ